MKETLEKSETDTERTERGQFPLNLQLFSEGHNDRDSAAASVDPSEETSAEEKLKSFSTVRQGGANNEFTKLVAIDGKTTTIDPITGTATITKGSFSLTIPNYANLAGLKTSTHQLLDAITVALTETGAKSPSVVLPLEEYMNRRGLKDRKEAKKQVKADLELLRQASITGEEKRGRGSKKETVAYSFVNIADSGELRRNGDIVFTFGNTFYKMLLGYPVMPYPRQLQTVNSKHNPNSYFLLRKIAEHKNMNVGKKNEDIISVKTLLGAVSCIPSYDEVMSADKHIDKRIIKPFERDMDALEDTLSWSYCHSNGAPLTDAELKGFSYELFISLLVKTEWKSYPDMTERLKRKAERMEQTKKKRGQTAKKKNTPPQA